MTKRKEIMKDAGIYVFSSYIAQFLDIVNGILMRRFLGPSSMGVWAFLQVIQNYAKHSSLGITTATARDVPYFRQKGDTAKVEEVKNLVYSFTVTTAIASAAVIVAFALWHRKNYSPAIFYGLLVVAALVILQRLYNLYVVLLRAHKEFMLTGILNIVSSFGTLLWTVVLTWKFQLYGFFAGMILNYVLLIFLIRAKTAYRFNLFFSWKAFLPLLSLGSAVLISDILRSILTSIDRLTVAKYLGFEALGIYSVALMADNYLYSLPNMFGVIFFPHFQEAFAKKDDPKDLEKYLKQPTLVLACIFPLLIGLVWCAADWIVPWLLPQYSTGIPALKILSLGSFFFAISHSYSTFLLTVKKHWLLIPIHGICCLFGFGINLWFIHWGWKLEGVAAAEGLIAAFYFFLLASVVLKHLCGWRQIAQFLLPIAGFFCYFSLVLIGVERLPLPGPVFIQCILNYAIFCAAMLPVLFWGEKKSGVLSTFKGMVSDFLKKKKAAKEIPDLPLTGTSESLEKAPLK